MVSGTNSKKSTHKSIYQYCIKQKSLYSQNKNMYLPLSPHRKDSLLIDYCQVFLGILIAICFVTPVFAAKVQTTTISLSLYNSYTGSQSLLTTWVSSGGVIYINTGSIVLDVSADQTSNYTISGDVAILTGNGTGAYTHQHLITLSSGEGNKLLQTIFMKNTEPNIPPPLSVFVDTTSPTAPFVNTVETVHTDQIFADWQPSVDTGVAGVTYTFSLSDEPSFTSPIEFTTQDTSILLESIHIPYQNTTLYRYISAQDSLWNTVYGSVWLLSYTDWTDESDSGSNPQQGGSTSSPPSDSSVSHATSEPDTSHWLSDLMAPLIHGTVPKYSSKIEHDSAPDNQWSTSIRVMLLNSPYPLDTINVFVLPKKLQKTGAWSDPLPHLLLLIRYLPDTIDKQNIYYLVKKIIHIRYLGIMLIFWILCYDIEIYKQRLYKSR